MLEFAVGGTRLAGELGGTEGLLGVNSVTVCQRLQPAADGFRVTRVKSICTEVA